jgi:hypothetical protein
MTTDDLKLEAAAGILQQRNVVKTDTKEDFFERTRPLLANNDIQAYNAEYERELGHVEPKPSIGFIRLKVKAAGV